MPDNTGERRSIIGLVIIIIVCVGVAVIHGHFKEYFYEDEVLSYTLSNSHKGAYFDISAGEWYHGSDFYDYLYVHAGEEFDWENVISNQKQDSHPPFYALLLHAFSSLFSGDFSKWAGILPNIIGLVAMLILLYLIVRTLYPERVYLPLLVCLICGMTVGIQNLTIYIRMYMVLMPVTALCMLWHIKMMKSFPIKLSKMIHYHLLLACITFLGFMTHWFYSLFAFYTAVFYCVYMLYKNKKRAIGYYILSMVGTAGMILIIWRGVFWQLFVEDTGNDAVTQDWSIGFMIRKICEMTSLVNGVLYDNRLKIVSVIIGCCCGYIVIKNRKNIKDIIRIRADLALISFVTLLYYVTAAAITPYVAYRYVSPVFPYLILLTILALEKVGSYLLRSEKLGLLLIVFFLISPELQILKGGLVDENRQIIDTYSTEHSDDICLFNAGITPEENVFELRKFDRIYAYSGTDFGGVDGLADADEVLIYIPDGEDPKPYFDAVQRTNPSLQYEDRLYVAYYSNCYTLSNTQ